MVLNHFKIILFIICVLFFSLHGSKKTSAAQLTISHSASMPPLSYLDANGNPQGIIIDIWKLWSKETGIDVKFKLTSWDKSLTAAINGNADVHGGLFYTEERAEKLHYSDKFFDFNGGLFVSNKIPDFRMEQIDNLKCGVIKEDFAKKFMEDNFPYVSLVIYGSFKELLEAAARDRIQIFAADYPVAIYNLNELGIENNFTYYNLFSKPIRPAVSKKHLEKLKEIIIGMNSISSIKKDQIIHKWLNIKKESPQWTVPATVVILIFTCAFLLFSHKKDILRLLSSKKE